MFLYEPEEIWPNPQRNGLVTESDLEIKQVLVYHTKHGDNELLDRFLRYFSDWHRLLKSVAWLIRFKRYLMVMKGRYTHTL